MILHGHVALAGDAGSGALGSIGADDAARGGDGSAALPLRPRGEGERAGLGREGADLCRALQAPTAPRAQAAAAAGANLYTHEGASPHAAVGSEDACLLDLCVVCLLCGQCMQAPRVTC